MIEINNRKDLNAVLRNASKIKGTCQNVSGEQSKKEIHLMVEYKKTKSNDGEAPWMSDIRQAVKELKDELTLRIDGVENRLDKKIDGIAKRLDKKIDAVANEVKILRDDAKTIKGNMNIISENVLLIMNHLEIDGKSDNKRS